MVTKILGGLFLGLILLVSGIFLSPVSAKGEDQRKTNIVPDKFIVVLRDNTISPQDVANEMAQTPGFLVDNVYTNALKGFSATIPQARLNQIKGDRRVQFISEDREIKLLSQVIPTGISRINSLSNLNKGTGIGVAVIDTGIDLTHPDLQANIRASYSCIRGKKTGDDDNGHGTHVAGTIAALNNNLGALGVAPEAKLIAVKVLNSQGSGTWSSVICGIDWVTANAVKYNIKVANMSLGGNGSSDNNCGNTNSDALHKAICKSTKAGVTYVVAAGNESGNASNSAPSSYDDSVITVSALADSDGLAGGLGLSTSYGSDDTFANFSNYGSVIDLGAPGVSIYSTWKDGGYNTISGTSMATPHVSGAAALYIKSHPGSTWSQVRDGLINSAEVLNSGHFDPFGLHPEPILQTNSL